MRCSALAPGLLTLGALVWQGRPLQAQIIQPAPPAINWDSDKKVALYGIGSLAFSQSEASDFSTNPAARLTLGFRPDRGTHFFLSFNKGAGLTRTAADSFDVTSIMLPETGSSAFLGSVYQNIFPWPFGHPVSGRTRTEVGPFIDVAWQSYGIKDTSGTYDFNVRYFGAGLQTIYHDYAPNDGNRFRAIGAVSYKNSKVPRASVDDFRAAFGGRDAFLNYHGLALKAAVQINDLTAEVEYQSVNERGSKGTVALIDGEYLVIRFTAAGTVLRF